MKRGDDTREMKNLTENIIRYESGEMTELEETTFFQHLINTGICWQLQGAYGRKAKQLIEEGVCNE
jgi:hypothetical protein